MIPGIAHDRRPDSRGGFRAHRRRVAPGGSPGARLPVEVVRMRPCHARGPGRDARICDRPRAGGRAIAGRDRGRLPDCTATPGAVRGMLRPGRHMAPHRGRAPGLPPARSGCAQRGAVRARMPAPFGTGRAALRGGFKGWPKARGLPPGAAPVIGKTAPEREMMTAGGLAGFLSGPAFQAGAGNAL